MPKLEEVYARLEKNKKRKKEISKMVSDELSHDARYKEIKEEFNDALENRKEFIPECKLFLKSEVLY